MPDAHVDETLEAVALVLRDLKTNFEGNLARIASEGHVAQESFVSRLTEVAQAVDSITAGVADDRREVDGQLKEVRQHLDAVLDHQREENEGRASTSDAVLEVLRQKIDETEKIGREAVDIARTTQESMLRLAEETKEGVKPLATNVDDVRARLQTMLAELAELDAKTLVTKDLDDLQSWVTDLSDRMTEKITVLDEQCGRLRDGEQKIREFFQSLAEDSETHTAKQQEFQTEILSVLEGLAPKQDLNMVQGLLEETTRNTAEAITDIRKTLLRTEEALQEYQEQTQQTSAHAQETVAAQQQELHNKIATLRADIFDDLDEDAHALIERLTKDSNRMLVEQAEQFITKLSENIRGERGPVGYVSRVQQWVPNYQFRELSFVRHRAGLWQANCDTPEEPGKDCKDWNLVATGIRSVAISPDEAPGSYHLLALDSEDFVFATEFQIPLPTFYKTWDAKRAYRYYDSVMEDGHRWLAVKDLPKGPPSRSEDWILFGMRGGRGAKGAKGDPGLAGPAPDMEEILDAYDQRRLNANGTPVFSYRGSWRFGANYTIGDFVRGSGVMALCREAHRAETPPTGANAQWEILFELPDLGAAEGPGPQELQAQITALTAQVEALTRRDT